MKKLLLLLTISPLFAYTMTSTEFRSAYEKLTEDPNGKITLCEKQNNEVIKKAIKQSSDDSFEFLKNEKEALKFIALFDSQKTFVTSDFEYRDLIRKNCSPENLTLYTELMKKLNKCNGIFDEFNFMSSLIIATKKNGWSTTTIEEVKALVLNYLKVQNAAEGNLIIMQLMSYDLLDMMIANNLLDKKFETEIKTSKADAQSLKARTKGNDFVSCSAFKEFWASERIAGDKTRIQLDRLLNKLQ